MTEHDDDPFLHSAAWKRVRQLALNRDNGMCQDCMKLYLDGMIRHPHRAEMVHHIIPRSERPDLRLNLANLVSLCNECHNRRHPEKGAGGRETYKGKMRIIKV